MAVRPLPGASYHTLGSVFHSFADVELESTGSSNVCDPPEKFCPSNESTPLLDRTPDNRKRSRRGLPLLLSILVFFCLLFTASAFSGYPTHRRLMSDVPDRHALIAIQAQSNRALVNENHDGALVAKDHKLKCRDGCQDVDVWDYRIFPMLNPSLDRTDVVKSAVVLHWQGTDSSLEPMLVSNSDAALEPQNHAQNSSSGDDDMEHNLLHNLELADVQSGVGMLIAVNSLLQSGYRPSRTLFLTLMLDEASDAPKVSEYLHATYEELGLGMKFEPQAPECKSERLRALRIFCALIGEEPGEIVTLCPISTISGHAQVKPFDEDELRVFRYIFGPTIDQAALTRLRAEATRVWTRLILEADRL